MPAFAAVAAWAAAASVATIVTTVGVAMTVVGAVTKNESLMKIGGVLSLAGGVASLAGMGAAAAGEAGAQAVAGEAAAGAAGEAATGSALTSTGEAAALDTTAATLDVAGTTAPQGMVPTGGVPVAQTAGATAGTGGVAPISEAAFAPGGQALGPGVPTPTNVGDDTITRLMKSLESDRGTKELWNTGAQMIGGIMQGPYKDRELDQKQVLVDVELNKARNGNAVPDITGLIRSNVARVQPKTPIDFRTK